MPRSVWVVSEAEPTQYNRAFVWVLVLSLSSLGPGPGCLRVGFGTQGQPGDAEQNPLSPRDSSGDVPLSDSSADAPVSDSSAEHGPPWPDLRQDSQSSIKDHSAPLPDQQSAPDTNPQVALPTDPLELSSDHDTCPAALTVDLSAWNQTAFSVGVEPLGAQDDYQLSCCAGDADLMLYLIGGSTSVLLSCNGGGSLSLQLSKTSCPGGGACQSHLLCNGGNQVQMGPLAASSWITVCRNPAEGPATLLIGPGS